MINLRKMNNIDASKVAELEKEIFSDAWSEQGICETLKQPHAQILIAEQEENILGYIILYCVCGEGEIARIAVKESNRGQGIGRRLMEYALDVCRQNDISKLLLEVRESNLIARRFYEMFGFVQDGVRKNFYSSPKEDAVLMSKMIPLLPTGSNKVPAL